MSALTDAQQQASWSGRKERKKQYYNQHKDWLNYIRRHSRKATRLRAEVGLPPHPYCIQCGREMYGQRARMHAELTGHQIV